MRYTIKDLSEGKCAVRNDGTLKELKEVLILAFPKTIVPYFGDAAYYLRSTFNYDSWTGVNNISVPTQSVKDFLTETKYKGKAVHCETQEQWDFVTKKLNRHQKDFNFLKTSSLVGTHNTINLTFNGCASKEFYIKNNWQVLSFQEWLDENGYVFEDKVNVLPEEWCIKVTSENKKMLVKWRDGGGAGWLAENEAPKGYIFSKYKGWWEETNNNNIYEITTEQFKKHILHQEGNKKHSYKDYKEGDCVVITEYEGKTDWKCWFMPGEVLKLGGEYWEGSIKNSFDACCECYPKGGGMNRSFEEDYKIRKATQEEIDNSQWGKDKPISVREEGNETVTEYAHQTIWKTNHIPLFTDKKPENVEIKLPELKVKLRNKRIKIKL